MCVCVCATRNKPQRELMKTTHLHTVHLTVSRDVLFSRNISLLMEGSELHRVLLFQAPPHFTKNNVPFNTLLCLRAMFG